MNSSIWACPEFADRLVDLSDGELPPDERALVIDHVDSCPACQAELRRLDASLSVLRSAITQPSHVALPHRRRTALAVGAIGAAVALLIAVTIYVANQSANQRGRESLAEIHPAPMEDHHPPKTEGPIASLSHEAALRRIALLEQQARLEMSLALMPHDDWYAESRAANERLLDTFRQATSAAPTKGSGVFGGNNPSTIQ